MRLPLQFQKAKAMDRINKIEQDLQDGSLRQPGERIALAAIQSCKSF
jgi:hypothetical protein